jgi:hypothetical protein
MVEKWKCPDGQDKYAFLLSPSEARHLIRGQPYEVQMAAEVADAQLGIMACAFTCLDEEDAEAFIYYLRRLNLSVEDVESKSCEPYKPDD